MAGRSHLSRDQVFGDGDEVVIGSLAILLARCVVPGRPELAAAADIGHHINATPLKPGGADAAAVARQQRDIESPVTIKQRRVLAVEFQLFFADEKIRYPSAIF